MMWLQEPPNQTVAFATDASLKGIAGFRNGQYFACTVQGSGHESTNIVHLEMWALMVAIKLWARDYTGEKIYIECDNMAVIHVTNGAKAKDRILQRYLREITFTLAVQQCEVKLVYVKSKMNVIPDILSRIHESHQQEKLHKLLSENPHWHECIVEPELMNLTYDW